jgi:hypothetical protein
MAQIIRYNQPTYQTSHTDNFVYKTNLSLAKVAGVLVMGAVYLALMIPCMLVEWVYTKTANFLRRVRDK